MSLSTKDDSRRVTLLDIARECGVSKITVSCALRDDRRNVSAATIRKVKAAALKLGYDPAMAHAARRLRYQNETSPVVNQLIGVYFPYGEIVHRYWALIFRGMQSVLLNHRYGLLACTWNAGEGNFSGQLPTIFRRGEVDGVVFFANEQNHRALLDGLRAEPGFGMRPVVAMGEPFPGCSAVLVDDFQAGYLQADHLLGLGHRRLLHFESTRLVAYVTQQRSRGMSKACLDHGLNPTDVLITSEWIWDDSVDLENAFHAILTSHPDITGILCPNDYFGLMLVPYLRKWGISVPEGISLIGVDDSDILPDENGQNSWTTVAIPLEELGCQTARLLLDRVERRIEQDTIQTLSVKLIERSTTTAWSPVSHVMRK